MLLQLPSDRQTGLAGADHEHLENCICRLFDVCTVGRHGGLLGMVCWLVTSVELGGPSSRRRSRRVPEATALRRRPSGVLLGIRRWRVVLRRVPDRHLPGALVGW